MCAEELARLNRHPPAGTQEPGGGRGFGRGGRGGRGGGREADANPMSQAAQLRARIASLITLLGERFRAGQKGAECAMQVADDHDATRFQVGGWERSQGLA